MIRKFFVSLCLTLLATIAVAEEAPDALARRVTDEVLDIVRKDKDIQNGNTQKAVDLVESKVVPIFNFPHMTALALGKDWRKANAQQQKQLADQFRDLLVRTYANALAGFKDQQIVYKPLKLEPNVTDVVVRSEIKKPGAQPIKLNYSVEKLDTGWKVYDVVVADVSLVANYRGEFVDEVGKSGIDGLIQKLAARNRELEAKNSGKADKK